MEKAHNRLSQQQKLQQTQTLSPQQLQLVRLLELPALEMEERTRAELQDNPALEEVRDDALPAADDAADNEQGGGEEEGDIRPEMPEPDSDDTDYSLGDYLTEDDIPPYKLRQATGVTPTRAEDIPFSEASSFYEQLNEQLSERTLSPKQRQLAEYLIGSLDDDGLLRKPLSEIADELAIYMGIDATEDELLQALRVLQDFDPPGLGARDLRECLLLQLRRLPRTPQRATAEAILNRCYPEFTRKRTDLIAQRLNLTPQEAEVAYAEITRLNPRPGSALGEAPGKAAQAIVPDFTVEVNEEDGSIQVSLNDQRMPRLAVNPEYARMLQEEEAATSRKNVSSSRRDALLFLKQKVESAKGFISAVQQRRQTLLSTMQAIVDLQEPFFREGDESLLRPMVLRDVAQRTGLDISTISRVSNSKWVQTPYGIYPLKHFFTDGYTLESGEETTSREIRRILKEHIDQEDKQHPLTDEELCALLQQKGYPLARRTVAKYRMQMQIPVARLRKR
ncbi:MAG: RNA polymerase factor sigma-54 [Bacteroidaceae bacterium]|jgi:RNA polymerase sigma-54 factor